MAAISSTYLPDLGKCLAGNELLLSWDSILQRLLAHDDKIPSHIETFFADSSTKDLLANSLPTFPARSSTSRSAFDSRTAAINATPSATHQYSIDEIKQNALWLSSEVDLDELEALRLTVLEWQQQPQARLKAGFSDAELASLRDALGVEYCESVGLLPGTPLSRSDTVFDTADGLKARLVELYFSESARLLAVSKELVQSRQNNGSDSSPTTVKYPTLLPQATQKPLNDLLHDGCEALDKHIHSLQEDKIWSVSAEHQDKVQRNNITATLQSIAFSLDILLLSSATNEVASGEVLLNYLQLLVQVQCFGTMVSDVPLQQTVINHIRTTSACLTLALLQPTAILTQLVEHPESRSNGYIYDHSNLSDIHRAISDFAVMGGTPASLAVLAWGLLLLEIRNLATTTREATEGRTMQKALTSGPQDGRRSSFSSTGSGHHSIYDDILREIPPGPTEDEPPEYLLNTALQEIGALDYAAKVALAHRNDASPRAASILRLLQDLIKQALPVLDYSPDLLSAQNAIFAPSDDVTANRSSDLPASFLEDQYLRESIFDVAAARFPYEALPLLRLCRLLARANIFDNDGLQYVAFRLKQLDTFTQIAQQGFSAYRTIREDENANLVELEHAVGVFDLEQHRYLTQGSEVPPTSIIPSQTVGEVISDSLPAVVKWQHSYSGLALLGKWIELHRTGLLGSILSGFDDPDEVVSEAIWLVVTLLQATRAHASTSAGIRHARRLCEELLSDFQSLHSPDLSLAESIFELAEHQIQGSRAQASAPASRDLLAACIDFLAIYTDLWPSRAWPLIAKSSIFGMSGAKRSALSVTGVVELPIQDFRLLESCSKFFRVIVRTASRLSVHNVSDPQTLSKQLKKGRINAAQRLSSSIISSSTDIMLSALEATSSWTFDDPSQKQRIITNTTSGFLDVIQNAFGHGDKLTEPTVANAAFIPAATSLSLALEAPGLQTSASGPLLRQLVSAILDVSLADVLGHSTTGSLSCLKLLRCLLRLNQMSGDDTALARKMLSFMPMLVRIPLHQPTSDVASNQLIHIILHSLPSGSSYSLLGHLGMASSICWADQLRQSAFLSPNQLKSRSLWKIYAQLVTLDQQWLAIVLITGSPPGRGQKEGETPKLRMQGKSCLQQALDLLSHPGSIDSRILVSLLEFVLESQRNWPSVSDIIASQPNTLLALKDWVINRDISSKQDLEQAYHNKVAALVTELLVLHLHRLILLKDTNVFTPFLPLLAWLAENAVSVAAYNSSLQTNLKKNFMMKYPAIDPAILQRSGLEEAEYGTNFFFDLDLANHLVGDDSYWNNGDQSFRSEFERANANLSIVDSELVLLRSFEYLCVEHAPFFARNREVARVIAEMVSNCLSADTEQTFSEKLFDSVFQTRANLSLTLLRSLVTNKVRGSDFPALLNGAWNVTRSKNASYENAILNNDLEYWRSCLNILLLALQFHSEKKLRSRPIEGTTALVEIDPYNSLYCEIARDIIGEGLRTAITALQAQHQDRKLAREPTQAIVGAKDITLLLSIFQTITRLKSLPQFTNQLSEILISTGAAQMCISLYTWSHIILEDGVPVYADLAVQPLASLSSLNLVAEDLAVEGILNRLLSAKTTQTLQNINGGVSHLDGRPNAQLLYSVWSQGILPICLNLLSGVGGPIAGEVSDFLNQFPNQLRRVTLSLSGAPDQQNVGGGILTLPLVREIATISLISYILNSYRQAGASAGVDAEAISLLSEFGAGRAKLGEDVRMALHQDAKDRVRRSTGTTEKEVEMSRWRDIEIDVQGRKEKKLVNPLDDKIVEQLRQARVCLGVDGEY